MKVIVQFDIDNDAFAGGDLARDDAIADTLELVAQRINIDGGFSGDETRFPISDGNGNTIGSAQLTDGGVLIR